VGALAFVPLWLSSEPEAFALQRLANGFNDPGLLWWVQQMTLNIPLLTGVCAIAALVAASYRVPVLPEQSLAFVGRLSLGIYVTHFRFVEMWKGMPGWFLPINVAIALVLSVGVTLLIGRWRVSATVLLGEPWTRKSRPLGDVKTETL
jgi:peptidoglycan/LPS O-acetylase OafA/YrhL